MRKKLAAIVAAMLVLQALPGFAQETAVNISDAKFYPESGKIQIAGTLGSGEKGKEVVLRVMNTAKTYEDIETDTTSVQKLDQTESDETGGFSFEFLVNTDGDEFESGSMIFYVDCDGAQYISSVYVSSESDIAAAFEALVSTLSEGGDVTTVLSESADFLAMNDSLFAGVNTEKLATLLKAEYAKDATCVSDIVTAQATVKKLALLQAYNEGKKELVANSSGLLYTDILKLDELDDSYNVTAYAYYTENMNASVRSKLASDLLKKGFSTLDDYYKAFVQAVVLEGVSNSPTGTGYGHVRDLITKNADYVGINLTSYSALTTSQKNQVDFTLSNKEYGNDLTTFQKALNSAVTSSKTSDTKTTSGGGGGGGGTGQTTISPTKTVSDDEKNTGIFTDLTGYDWAKTSIETLYDKGIVSGINESEFAPENNVTREQFTKMLVLALGISVIGEQSEFTDSAPSQWYDIYLAAAKNSGIVLGRDDGSFGVGENITRQDACVMLTRALETSGKELSEPDELDFTDKVQISDYAEEAVGKMSAVGVIKGYDTNEFGPTRQCTRAEAAVIITRVLSLI